MENLLRRYFLQKEVLKKAQEALDLIGEEIYLSIPKNEIPEEGVFSFKGENFKLALTTKYNVKVDEKIACLYPNLFKTKFEFSKTIFKDLSTDDQNKVSAALTKTPAKPSFKVELINGNN